MMNPDIEQLDAVIYLQQWNGFQMACVNERFDPIEVHDYFSDYIDRVASAVGDFQGIVVNLDHQQLVAIFDDIEPSRAVERAVDCALESERRINIMSNQWLGQEELRLTIGMHFGQLMYGRFGSADRRYPAELGQSLAVARQVLGNARGETGIIVSESVQSQQPSRRWQARDSIRIKGLQNPLALYRLQD